jgi:uncharacterized protein (TIGR03083 family)
MNAPGRPTSAEYLAQLRADARRIAEVLPMGPADASVAACPDWTITDLVKHLGGVHRWASRAVVDGEAAARSGSTSDVPDEALGAWLVDGADALTEALAAVPDDEPAWNPFGAPQTAALWARRQAHETMMHRWDAEEAVGLVTPLPPLLASDGIDELFEVLVPRNIARGSVAMPTDSLHIHCTDVEGEWLMWIEDGRLVMRREHAKGAAALRGPAESLLLLLWGRTHLLDEAIDVVGDADVAIQWTRLTS